MQFKTVCPRKLLKHLRSLMKSQWKPLKYSNSRKQEWKILPTLVFAFGFRQSHFFLFNHLMKEKMSFFPSLYCLKMRRFSLLKSLKPFSMMWWTFNQGMFNVLNFTLINLSLVLLSSSLSPISYHFHFLSVYLFLWHSVSLSLSLSLYLSISICYSFYYSFFSFSHFLLSFFSFSGSLFEK